MINKVKFRIKGISAYPLNMLSRKGIRLTNIRFFDKYIEFFINATDLTECERLLTENKREYQIRSFSGITFFLNKLKKRIGVFIGAFIFIVVSVCYSLTILTINISGNELVATETIQKKVAKTISPPLFNAKIDKKFLEKSIIEIEGISSASVSKIGTTINIEVLEELPLVDIEDIKGSYKPIISKYDSLVTRVIVSSGTPLIKIGQAVQEGQELILPYLLVDDETKVLCKAMGEVYGKIWLTKSQYYDEKELVFTKTGKEYVYYDIKPLNWIRKKEKNPFIYYEEKTEIVYIGAVIPIKAIKHTYYETEKNYIDFDFDMQSDILIEELSKELDLQIPAGGEFVRSWHEIKRLDKKTQLVIYYEIETLIV